MKITCNISRVINKPQDNEAIADTGTTDHFIKDEAPCDEKEVTTDPINVEMPNGSVKRALIRATSEFRAYPKN